MNICIVGQGRPQYSETFIRAHHRLLRGTVHFVYGGDFPVHSIDGGALVGDGWLAKADRLVSRAVCGRQWRDFEEQAFAGYLRRHDIDVVLAEYGPTGVAVMDVCRCSKVPLVVHFHGYDAYRDDCMATNRDGYRRLFLEASGVVAVSGDMCRQLVSLGASDSLVTQVPYGIDVDRFCAASPADAPPVFVAVGRFVDKKAPQLTLLAFHRVMTACPRARLVMLGDGPLLECCRSLTQALGIEAAVEFRGAVGHDEVAEAMGGARCFVQHSVRPKLGPGAGDSEGTPLSVLEAGASGLPVVSTRHAGIPEAVLDGKSGFLVDERDWRAMADHMAELAMQPEKAAAMGICGREHVREHYASAKAIGQLQRVLETAAAANRRG